MKRVRTLFLVLDMGISIRNVLRTDVLPRLRECSDLRIVILSPVTDRDFVEEFGGDRVVVEPLRDWQPRGLAKLLRSIRKDLWAERSNAVSFKLKREKKHRTAARLLTRAAGSLPLERLFDRTLRTLEQIEPRLTPRLESELFDRYRPDLVFASSIYTTAPAVAIGATQRRIPVVGFMQSWDNPTTKGPLPFVPDRVVVWNDIVRREVLEHHGIPLDRMFVSGVPQFDLYTHTERFRDRETFLRRWGLEPSKRLIVYTTGSHRLLPDERLVVERLDRAVRHGEIGEPCQLLVRLHPKDHPELYDDLVGRPGVVVQRPGRVGDTKDRWNPSEEDMYDLAEVMRYADVVVNVASTITIDAACFDTPIVNVRFDGSGEREYLESCRRYYDYDHYRNVVATGGVRLADSPAEMIEAIRAYLDDPSLDGEGRERIRREQCWKLDGQSGRRIAEYVLAALDELGDRSE